MSVSDSKEVIGYKAFNSIFCCRGFQYQVGHTYQLPVRAHLKICQTGFHFCLIPWDVFHYYPRDWNIRVALVQALGQVITEGDKSVTDYIKIVEEIPLADFLEIPWENPVLRANGDQEWYQHGKLHRDEKPAIIRANGDQFWYQSGRYVHGYWKQFKKI